MLVKFSGHNFSSFLLCPGGPLRHVARHRQCRRAMERPEDMAMAGSLAETIFACHTSRLGTLNALLRGGGDGDGGGSPPAALHARLPPGCQAAAAGRGGGEATFPAPLTPSGQQAPGPAAPASAPLRPASLFPPGAASAPSGRPVRRGARPIAASRGREEPGRAEQSRGWRRISAPAALRGPESPELRAARSRGPRVAGR